MKALPVPSCYRWWVVLSGIMNTVGWGGGGLGPIAFGWLAMHGHGATEVANMSAAISFGGLIYVLGGLTLIACAILVARNVARPLPAT